MKQVEPKVLEDAMPSLIAKLQELQGQLTQEENEIFKGIIEAASRHTRAINMLDDEDAFLKLEYTKPMSVHATERIRRDFLSLPRQFGA